eukprot:579476-Pyramimonas_sp.AAC.1
MQNAFGQQRTRKRETSTNERHHQLKAEELQEELLQETPRSQLRLTFVFPVPKISRSTKSKMKIGNDRLGAQGHAKGGPGRVSEAKPRVG